MMRLAILGIAVLCVQTRYTVSYSTINPATSKSRNLFGWSQNLPKSNKNDQFPMQHRSTTISNVLKTRSLQSAYVRGWHRRLLSKFLPQRHEGAQTKMEMMEAKITEREEGSTRQAFQAQDEFIARNFDTESPESLFSDLIAAEFSLPLDEESCAEPTNIIDKGSPFVRITRKTFQKILMERLDKWSKGMNSNIIVECDPTSNILQFFRGQFHCDATINLDRIIFGNIQISGGQLQAKNFCLNLFSFAPFTFPLAPSPRFPSQFDLLAQNMTFTQDDLWESSCIRNGLRRLIKRILKNRGLTAMNVSIQSIRVLATGKLSCIGQATALFGPPVVFELRSRIDTSGRGHILTFPGLEISVSPALGFFVPVIPDITVDLGHNAQLLDVFIDGDNAQVKVSACVTITPEHTLQLKQYVQSSHSYGALCSVDVGRWLTRIGHFAH
jgi:hypothetical protein